MLGRGDVRAAPGGFYGTWGAIGEHMQPMMRGALMFSHASAFDSRRMLIDVGVAAPKSSLIAERGALEPSITNWYSWAVDRLPSINPHNRSLTTWAFSLDPPYEMIFCRCCPTPMAAMKCRVPTMMPSM